MAKKKQPILVSSDGKKEWQSENPTETVNLRARGWKEKQEEKQERGTQPPLMTL